MITEPGAEYDATYQSVIRIKTTRKKGEGLGLTYRQVYQRNHQNNHREVLDLNYRYRGLDIFSNLYGGLSQGYQDQHNDNRLYGKTLMSIDENLIIKTRVTIPVEVLVLIMFLMIGIPWVPLTR